MFKDYRRIKVLKTGGRSLRVTLLENKEGRKIIMKQYDPDIQSHRDSFKREIKILNGLADYPFVPKLLDVDYDNYTFYETYCGKVVPRNHPNYNKVISGRTKDLYKKYDLRYVRDDDTIWLVHWQNYCIMDGTIYMIDFGSARWVGELAEINNDNNDNNGSINIINCYTDDTKIKKEIKNKFKVIKRGFKLRDYDYQL